MTHLTPQEQTVGKFALGVVAVAAPVSIVLSSTHGYGQTSLSNPAAVTYEVSMSLTLLGVGALVGVTLVGMLRGDRA